MSVRSSIDTASLVCCMSTGFFVIDSFASLTPVKVTAVFQMNCGYQQCLTKDDLVLFISNLSCELTEAKSESGVVALANRTQDAKI